MPEQDKTPAKHKKRSGIVTVAAWGIVALLVPLCIAWILGGWLYWFDLVASQQMLIGWMAFALAGIGLSFRRWTVGAVCVALAIVSLYPVFTGRIWSLPRVDFEQKPDDVIRIVSCNINPLNEQWAEGVHRLLDLGADVVIVIELSPEMSRSIDHRNAIVDDRYPYRSYRMWVRERVSAGVVFSRWPIEQVTTTTSRSAQDSFHYRRVDHPSGSFIVGLLHPLSPRDNSRWEIGNQVIDGQAQLIEVAQSNTGLPMVVGADLNAGPAMARARTIRNSGMRMSKPAFRVNGSFPANSSVPAILRIQLDDIWSLGDITPVAWSVVDMPGSDHRAIVVDLMFNAH